MEARRVLEQLAEPINAHISGHEVIEVNGKSVSWYTIETTWRRGEHTKKKQRFKFIQEALLRVRDAKERLKIGVQLPMLPLSIIRGTSEIIRSQRASEFNAFLAAALSVPQLRALPALVLLLAPDEVGSSAPSSRGIPGPSERGGAGPSRSSSDTADLHGPHAIQSLAHLGHSDMDSANWPSADASAVSTADVPGASARKRTTHSEYPEAVAGPSGGGAGVRRGATGDDGGRAGAHGSAGGQHPAMLPRQNAHSFGFDVPQLGRQMPYCAGETTVVGSAPKLAAMRSIVERCRTAVEALAGELETRDATIRQQADRIAALEDEVQRLRPA